jgi:hypothetical protein
MWSFYVIYIEPATGARHHGLAEHGFDSMEQAMNHFACIYDDVRVLDVSFFQGGAEDHAYRMPHHMTALR